MKGVSPSVRNAVVALRVYATELERERIKLDEEYVYYEDLLKRLELKGKRVQPLAQKVLRPIFEISDHMNLNLTQIEQVRRQNADLRSKIRQSESKLSEVMEQWRDITEKSNHLEGIVSDYQHLFAEIATPPPLPYPYDTEWEINWAIINEESVELPDEWQEKCARIAELSGNFNELKFEEKVEVVRGLKDIKGYIRAVLKEMKRIEHEVTNELRRKTLTQICVKQYAAMALTMQKVHFFEK